MKGLQHNVIEIRETDNQDIEKILVFLKPGEHQINVSNTRAQAQDILQRVKIRKKFPRPQLKNMFIPLWICSFVAIILMILFLW